MSEPANTQPAACPRVDGTCGPRRCAFVECRHHLWEIRPTGARPNSLRVLAQRECDDTCSLDVAERARLSSVRQHAASSWQRRRALSLREIGAMFAMAEPNVHRLLKRALRHYRAALIRDAARG